MAEPKNERAVCLGALRFLEGRRGERIRVVEEPDRVERQKQAVEMVAASDSARFVVEHTRVESFERQIADGQRINDLMGPMETVLPAFLPPGTYEIIIQPHAAASVRSGQLESVRLAAANWITETAPRLDLGSSVTARPPGVPFDVTLRRRLHLDDGVVVFGMRFMPPAIEEPRRSRIRTALATKCPKLAAAKHQNDALSVLLLESDDIALANSHVISEAVVGELTAVADHPDFVFLVETDRGLAWLLWIVKDLDLQYPAIAEPGPFKIDPELDDSVSAPAADNPDGGNS